MSSNASLSSTSAGSLAPAAPDHAGDSLGMRPSRLARGWKAFRRNRLAIPALVIIASLTVLVVGAPLLAEYVTGYGPNDQDLIRAFEPPSADHWLGTDEYGRDLFTRLAYGGRVSLGTGILASIAMLAIGTLVGAVAAYFGGLVDQVTMRFVDVLVCIPGFSLLLLISALFTFGPVGVALIIAAFGWFGLARLIRAEVLSVRERPYVESARAVGATDAGIIGRHILPNTIHLLIVAAAINIPGFLLAEAGLSYLGLGIQPPAASWGNMLSKATQYLYSGNKLLLFAPGVCIWLTVFAFSVLGNALRDALDPRLTS